MTRMAIERARIVMLRTDDKTISRMVRMKIAQIQNVAVSRTVRVMRIDKTRALHCDGAFIKAIATLRRICILLTVAGNSSGLQPRIEFAFIGVRVKMDSFVKELSGFKNEEQ
jgi:hypothetical protein